MKASSKAVIVIITVLGVGIFGYSQYASASQIGVVVAQSELVGENGHTSTYSVELEFENPSLLVLAAGESEFFVISEEQTVGEGKLEPFVLPAMGSSTAKGTFQTELEEFDESEGLKISGLTKYDVFFTSMEIPFVFYPTQEQVREFID